MTTRAVVLFRVLVVLIILFNASTCKHRSLVCLLVVGVEVSASLRGHRSSPVHIHARLSCGNALMMRPSISVPMLPLPVCILLDMYFGERLHNPLEVVLTLAESLPLRPFDKLPEALDGGGVIFFQFHWG